MYWIIGIIVFFLIIIYFLNKRQPVTSNIASRYFALKDIFGNDDEISESRYLEMAGVFSQIIYIRNGEMTVDEIREQVNKAVENKYNIEDYDKTALIRFCASINKKIYMLNGFDQIQASMKLIKETDAHEKVINKIKTKGYSKLQYNSTNNYVMQFPGCLSGNYSGL